MMEHYVEKHTATLVLDARATLGEGALWCPRERVLYWVDIEGKKLHRFDPATRRDRWLAMPVMVSSVVPVAEGGLLLSLEHSIIRLHWSLGSYHVLASVEPDQPGNRCNDGKCDPAGRYWIGTMHLESEEGAGSLYCFTPSLTVAKKRGGVTISNGLAWSADHRRMYYIDTPTGQVQILAFDNETGTLGKVLGTIPVPEAAGVPDGMAIDGEGNLWVALWGGFGVGCWDPTTGRLIRKVEVPAPHVTSCAFGGNDQRTLFITTARSGLTVAQLAQYPLSGGLFAVRTGVRGLPPNYFAGAALPGNTPPKPAKVTATL
jgi:sugar lactone lactonase YvrE